MATKSKNINKSEPNIVDIHVGKRLRSRRALLGMSQEKLAESVGLTFQQIQKYERGTNRISSSKLYAFAKALQTTISYFFENLEAEDKKLALGMSDNEQAAIDYAIPKLPSDVMDKKETLDLIRSYYSIKDDKVRKNVLNMIKSMAEDSN